MGEFNYSTKPLHPVFGIEVIGLSLHDPKIVPVEVINRLKSDLIKHRLLLFRNQGQLSPDNHVTITSWFGRVENTFLKHKASPHPDIYPVSNDENVGFRNVGRSGWHIDGTYREVPYKVQTMHFWKASEGGFTMITPMHEALQKLPRDEKKLFDKLYIQSNDYGLAPKPLVYPHPITKKDTMVFHLGPLFVQGFHVNYDYETGKYESTFTIDESINMLKRITEMMEDKELMLTMEWKDGDLAILDNLAVAHYPHPDTQLPPEEVGLRIMHRTTVAGDSILRKTHN